MFMILSSRAEARSLRLQFQAMLELRPFYIKKKKCMYTYEIPLWGPPDIKENKKMVDSMGLGHKCVDVFRGKNVQL